MTEHRDDMRDEAMDRADTEKLLADWFQEDAPKQEPPVLLPAVLARTAMTRRRAKWLTRDWWLSTLGLVDRRPPPMMLSLGFVAILTALTLLAAFALVPAADDEDVEEPPPGTIVVAADGSGDYLTVAEGVEAAQDGNTILIRPGFYTEAVDTTKELTFRGDGADRSDVLIGAAEVAMPALRIEGAPTTIENLTVRIAEPTDSIWEGTVYQPFGIEVIGGPAQVREVEAQGHEFAAGCALVLELVSDFAETGQRTGPRSTISDSRFVGTGGGVCTGSAGQLLIEGNTFEDLDVGMRVAGEAVEVKGNTFLRNEQAVISAFDDEAFLQVTVDDNDFQANGISVRADGGDVTVTGNTFDGDEAAVRFVSTSGSIADNTLSGIGRLGISLTDSDPLVERNVVTGGADGISITRGDPWLMANEFENLTGSAVQVSADSEPKIVGNAFCSNAVDLDLAEDADDTAEGNSVCTTAETRTWEVAPDGSGDFTTVKEAVDAAVDGDTVLVHPGTYDESIVVGKDITIRGTGERGEAVIEVSTPFPAPAEWSSMDRLQYVDPPFAFWIVESDLVLENLTIRGQSSTIVIRGGAPTLQELDLLELGYVFSPPAQDLMPFAGVLVEGGSRGTLRDSTLQDTDMHVFQASPVAITGNTFAGGGLTIQDPGSDALVARNTFIDSVKWAVAAWHGAAPTITENDVTGARTGIDVHAVGNPVINANSISDEFGNVDLIADADAGYLPDAITSATIEGNRIEGSGTAGVRVHPYAQAVIVSNVLTDDSAGIWLERPGETRVEANEVSGGAIGIDVAGGAVPLDGNEVTGAQHRGIAITGSSEAVLTGNTACDNEVNLWISEDATPVVDDSNLICSDAD